MSIIGIILGVIAIGLFVWLYTWYRDQEMNIRLLESELEGAKHAYEALINDLNNYQIKTDRKIVELEKQLELKTGGTFREIDKLKKDLPLSIRKVIGHIEFSQNNLR